MQRLNDSPDDTWMHDTLHATRVGRWSMPLDTLVCSFDDALLDLVGARERGHSFHITEYFDMVYDEDRPMLEHELEMVLATHRSFDLTFRLRRHDTNETVWINSRGSVHMTPESVPVVYGINYDVTAYKESESHSWVVAGEMGHRVKNLLAVLNAIFRFSAANSNSIEDLSKTFTGRIEALRKLNDLLLMRDNSIELGTLIRDIAAPLLMDDRVSISVEPGLLVNGGFAQMFALSVNELMTNAIKHGALRGNDGVISIDVKKKPSDGMIEFHWREQCSEPISAPTDDGFGMKVLNAMAGMGMAGKPEFEWSGHGLKYSCSWPCGYMIGH